VCTIVTPVWYPAGQLGTFRAQAVTVYVSTLLIVDVM
jgi:hypothetical protein